MFAFYVRVLETRFQFHVNFTINPKRIIKKISPTDSSDVDILLVAHRIRKDDNLKISIQILIHSS